MNMEQVHHAVNETCLLLSFMCTEPVKDFSLTTAMKMKLADVQHMCQHFYFMYEKQDRLSRTVDIEVVQDIESSRYLTEG